MKRILTAVAALAVFAVAVPQAQAQDTTKTQAPVAAAAHPDIFNALLKDITLTDAQKAKVDSIAANYRDQLGPDDPQMDSTAVQKKRDLVERVAVDLKAVLDPEQQKVFEKNLADVRAKWGAKPSE